MASKKKLEPATKPDSKVAAEPAPEKETPAPAEAPAKTETPAKGKKRRTRKTLDHNMYVVVCNGFHGPLFYRDRNTGEEYNWDEFGDEAELTIGTLLNARNTQRRFFQENWWLIDDPEVIDYLGVGQYYKNALTYDDFDELFKLTPEEVKTKVERLSNGQKRSVVFMAREQIASGDLSDLNIVKVLEDALQVELLAGR